MVDYPIEFRAEVEDEGGEEWILETEEGLRTEMNIPEEFGGGTEKPSPEDLFNASLASCILATFRVTAERKGLEYDKITSKCSTSLDRGEEGRPVMKEAEINVRVEGVSDQDLAEKIGEISEKNCFIHNSVETEVRTEFEFAD
ncbi:MAG: OsmC family protein [Candidatus Nanosalina sp.]